MEYIRNIVYRKIAARILEQGMTRREVADMLGITYGTLLNKLCAVTAFTLPEAIQIKQILQMDGALEDCFARCDNNQI